ncbi:hypothetical protein ABN034_24450 [Actinopolymorpha sp. B11F2]|uniref:hypothetical protein n=1 Tax=Actinopolymorpha sp. B11F2 TaxID=3160862 RepID=UPI0032E46802
MPPTESGPVHPEQWPDACTFLTDREINALLPGHENVERTPEPVTVLDPDFMSDDNLTGDAKSGSCDYQIHYSADRSIDITITITTVADPETVRPHYEQERASAIERKTKWDFVKSVDVGGADACFRSGSDTYSTLECHRGPLAFEVSTSGHVEIEGVSEDPNQVLQDRLQPEVVKTLTGKIG